MNEPKQMIAEEAIELFCDRNCYGGAKDECSSCAPLKEFIRIAKENNWIKPDPTPEEKFMRWYNSCTISEKELREKVKELAAEIRAERRNK